MVLPVVDNASSGCGTVFVVDRDEYTRRKVSSVARSAGLTTEIVESAAEFFEHYNPDTPGCIVLNIHEPCKHADAAYAKVKSFNLGLRTIFVAGNAEITLAIHATCIIGHDC